MQQELRPVERRETEGLLIGFLETRARTDESLTVEQSETIVGAVANEANVSSSDASTTCGKRLAAVGDEIDAIYRPKIIEVVEESRTAVTAENALAFLSDVARVLFELDAGRTANINMGRICALLMYCYELCRQVVQNSLPASTLMVLLGSMGGWLVTFFTKIGFYTWLREQGGWAQLLAGPVTTLLVKTLGRYSMLVGGVLLIGGFVYITYFKK